MSDHERTGTITTGWRLDRGERAALLALVLPRWPDVVADHVTLASRVDPATPLPPTTTGEIIGIADDDAGVQALVVSIDGSSDRPDGSHYHITWSLDRSRGRTAVESNAVIAQHGWQPLTRLPPVTLIPARLR